jgi:hypothetical protein
MEATIRLRSDGGVLGPYRGSQLVEVDGRRIEGLSHWKSPDRWQRDMAGCARQWRRSSDCRLFPGPAREDLAARGLAGPDEHARRDPVVALGRNTHAEQVEQLVIEERIQRTLGDPE